MRIYEYKHDANDCGNEIVPCCISHSDCDHFYNPANHTFIGARLSDRVKVPDTMVELDKAGLLARCKIAGIMMKNTGTMEEPVMTQMTDEEIAVIVDEFCAARSIV